MWTCESGCHILAICDPWFIEFHTVTQNVLLLHGTVQAVDYLTEQLDALCIDSLNSLYFYRFSLCYRLARCRKNSWKSRRAGVAAAVWWPRMRCSRRWRASSKDRRTSWQSLASSCPMPKDPWLEHFHIHYNSLDRLCVGDSWCDMYRSGLTGYHG